MRAAARVLAACRDIVRGAAGADAYGQYVAHLATFHPEQQPLTREAYFRQESVTRWEGMRRCC